MSVISEQRLLARAILEQVPHLKGVPKERIETWLDAVERIDPDRMVWHAKRVFNWGGSELGTLVQTLRNLRAEYANELGYSHQNIESLVKSKLLLKAPDKTEGPTLRGSLIEPYVIEMFLHQLREKHASVVVRDDISEQMRKSAINNNHFSIRMDPDLIVEVDDKRILYDIKAPSSAALKSAVYDDPLSYKCQLNGGYDIARKMENPYEFDELKLVVYNHDKGCLDIIDIDIEEDLIEEIYEASSYFTPFVLRGEVPSSKINHLEIVSQNDLPDALVSEISKLSVMKLALQHLTDHIVDTEARIANYTKPMAENFQENFQCKIGPAVFKGQSKRTFDKTACYEALVNSTPVSEHAALASIKNNSVKLQKAAKQHLDEAVIADLFYEDYEVKYGLSTAKQGLQHDLKSDLKSVLGQNIDSLLEGTLDVLEVENGIMTEQVPRNQAWDLRDLVRAFENYRHDDSIAGKARVLLEERIEAYGNSAEVALARAVPGQDDGLIESNIQLQGLISKIISNVIEPANANVSETARSLDKKAKAQNQHQLDHSVPAESEDAVEKPTKHQMNVMNFS
ncbi:hypothetical protein [Vibrio parahaemolyticus]|uniref:hypothetical protein n=1 Tax=Vibrio parahaemolyticus TaxID=670 RepID=UPI0008139D79|nr:hypothetical protein [Vibrio parahaemolyticus]OCP68291.1 hypothetical protein AKH08_15865 [Vibrio parahaemolyticus]